jgi:hypothetical protein
MEQTAHETMETKVLIGRGFNPDIGILVLDGNKLQLKIKDVVIFDEPIARLRLAWPWYGFGCQFWAHTEKKNYFVSLMGIARGGWWEEFKHGRKWHNAIKSSDR